MKNLCSFVVLLALSAALFAPLFGAIGCSGELAVAKNASDGGASMDDTDSSTSSRPDGATDAATGDHDGGARFKTAITPGVVGCGPNMPGCEAPTIQCCFGSSTYRGCALATGVCTVQWELLCDGPEDCDGGEICSGNPDSDPSTVCASAPSVYQICHDHTQCPSSAPNCCPVQMNVTDGPQLGECDTRTELTNGACDTP